MLKVPQGKIFVLDTSVIIYDHQAVNNFQEHDVAIPITVLEELDKFKKGNAVKNFSAREFLRFIDALSKEHLLQDWLPLNPPNESRFRVLIKDSSEVNLSGLSIDLNDHKILGSALALQEEEPDKLVVLVTKDTALRLKAKALNLVAEDYETGKVDEVELDYSGKTKIEDLDAELIDQIYDERSVPAESVGYHNAQHNQYFILKNGKKSALAKFSELAEEYRLIDKVTVTGVAPRNAEQIFAINALMDDSIQLLTLQGKAGTGKTLLALASAIEQRRDFRQIYITRPTVPLSNSDIGYLPGDINSKINPYIEPLWDNLKFIKGQYRETDREYKMIEEMVRSEKIEILPLTYIRGRSLSNVFIIVDEAQNLTPHEVKTIITRAGVNTKIVFTGDINQIDTPYLDQHSNGLSYLTDKLKGHPLFGHVRLEKGERSELADLASDLL